MFFDDVVRAFRQMRKRQPAPERTKRSPLEGRTIAFGYINPRGHENDWTITVNRTYVKGSGHYFVGTCTATGNERTFRSDRVEWLEHPQNFDVLESIDAEEWLNSQIRG